MKKYKYKMKTLSEAVLNYHEIDKNDGKLTVKEAVLQECDDAKCIAGVRGSRIVSGRRTYGKGITANVAWEDAILKILSIDR